MIKIMRGVIEKNIAFGKGNEQFIKGQVVDFAFF